MCSTEEDTRSSQEGVKEEAATMKTAHGGPVATCGHGHRETGRGKPRTQNIEVSAIPRGERRVRRTGDASG